MYWILASKMDLYFLTVFILCYYGKVTSEKTVPRDFLLYTDLGKHSIYHMDISSQKSQRISTTDVEGTFGIDYDHREGRVFWADAIRDEINSIYLNGSYQKNILKAKGNSNFLGLAIDSERRLLFVADFGKHEIIGMTMDESKITVIFNISVQRPFDIVLDLSKRQLYWTDMGKDPKIETADYDGTHRRSIINKHLKLPRGIALDHKAGIIYWCDAGNENIEKSYIDGTNRQLIHRSPGFQLNGLFLYGDILLYTQESTRSIMSVSTNGSDVKRFGPSLVETPFAIHVFSVDECLSSPCLNNGTCIDGVNVFYCTCEVGFTGDRCETDDCLSSPCLNNGSCTDDVNNYICTCETGFTGERCETDIDDCQLLPCLNNGSCADAVNNYMCTCETGFTGVKCETDIDDCQILPCLNNGSCTDAINNYTCTCETGFTGVKCETETGFTCVNCETERTFHSSGREYGYINLGIGIGIGTVCLVGCLVLITICICSKTRSKGVRANINTEQAIQGDDNGKQGDTSHENPSNMNMVNMENKERSSQMYEIPLKDVDDSGEGHYSVICEDRGRCSNVYDSVD